MAKPFISLSKLRKTYKVDGQNSDVLKELSLDIYSGELVAILGVSGSGKSTLMNILGLLDTFDAGAYLFKQQDISILSQSELARLRNRYIGFVFQHFNLLPRFSAKENIALPLSYRDTKKSEIDQRVTKVLESVSMQNFAKHYPSQLSGGQQQRVAIARALVGEPELILADEPTGALDSKTGAEVFSLFLSLNQQGRTIIIVTHDEALAKKCQRCITLVDGQVEAESFA